MLRALLIEYIDFTINTKSSIDTRVVVISEKISVVKIPENIIELKLVLPTRIPCYSYTAVGGTYETFWKQKGVAWSSWGSI